MDVKETRSMKIRFTHAVLALCVFPTAAVAGVPKGVWFSGGSVSESTSVYGGSIFSLPRQALGHGWAVRVSTGAGRYQYTTAGTDIIGKYLSGEAAIVHQSSGPWGWLNLSAGPRFSQTYLSPNDPGNRLRGSHIDLGIQSDGALDDSRGRLSWFGAYGLRNRTYQAKLQLAAKIANGISLGTEAGIQGEPTYHKAGLGGFVRKTVGKVDLEIGAGFAKQGQRSSRPYASIGLSQVF